MKKTIITLWILFQFIFAGNAQQANYWYFGYKAGLNFNTSPPTPLADGELSTNEGCSAISDNLGNLLFYTDGRKVWNKNHLVMPNGDGLMGHTSSTHSAIVIPKPGSSTIYYLFTADADENLFVNGYRYSEVDITLNGGLGDINANKNILLFAPGTEKMTAASHANGIDIWLITKELNNHVFRSYKITCNGIDNTPVMSTVTAITASTYGYKTGCIKVSPDGTKIASGRNGEGKLDIFKFDNSTGIISDRILITQNAPPLTGSYGIEFSPNSQLLYATGTYTWQYKLDVYDSAAIFDTRYQVESVFVQHGAIQLGPDNKIYCNTFPNTSVINNPNQYGIGCNYTAQAIQLGRDGRTGLPTIFGRLVTNYNVDYTYITDPDCKTVHFSATTSIPGPVTWQWDFGDGNTGTGQNITHVFPNSANTFTVTLTINNNTVCGGNSIRSKVITFDRVPATSNFGYTTSCGNLAVNFHDSSTIAAGGTIVSYKWDFGDGFTSFLQNPSHTYLNYGTYTVKLIIESADACHSKDTLSKVVTIAAKPVSSFSFIAGCISQAVQFTDNSSIVLGNITSWRWYFGDGNTSAIQSPSHSYALAGTYIVKLVTTSQLNCISDTFQLPVTVGAVPIADYSVPGVCLLDSYASFTNTSSTNDGSILSYQWNFNDPNANAGNPNTSVLINPTHQYSAAAVYNVQLITTSSLGCKDTIVKPFTVNGATPKAHFSLMNSGQLCSNSDVIIKDSSSVDFGNITKLSIDWGDGNVTIDNNPAQIPNGSLFSHRYSNFNTPTTRTFTITMKSYSGVVCVDTYSKNIIINASPAIRFDPIPDLCKESIPILITQASVLWALTGTGTYSGNGITNPATGLFNPALVDSGNHLISWSFTSTAGCRTDSTKYIRINPTPRSSFSYIHGCLPNAGIQFSSTATIPGGSGSALQHLWNFGDAGAGTGNPNTSGSINPMHIYHTLDTFAVQLQTISVHGCKHDTVIKLYPNIDIYPQPKASFIIDSLHAICSGSPIHFIDQSNNGGQPVSQYYWNFGDGNLSATQNAIHTYNTHGNFTVSHWLMNAKGCYSDTIAKPIIVHSIPKAGFVFDSTCFGKPVQFTDISTNALGAISAWDWNLGNSNISTVQNPVAPYQNYQAFTVNLKVSTSNKCNSSPVSKTFTLRRVNIFAGNDTSIARNQPLQLLATGAANYLWTPANGLNNSNIYNPVTVLNNSYQTYYVRGTTSEGCIGFDTINIKVFDKADIYVPTAFSPNGDNLNDFLQPICIGIRQLNYFNIYNRWGKLVFSTKNQYDNWDGKINGIPVPISTLVWIGEAIGFDGKLMQRKGTITLIR